MNKNSYQLKRKPGIQGDNRLLWSHMHTPHPASCSRPFTVLSHLDLPEVSELDGWEREGGSNGRQQGEPGVLGRARRSLRLKLDPFGQPRASRLSLPLAE